MTSSPSEETVVHRSSAAKETGVRTTQGSGHGPLGNSVFATHSVITHPSPTIKIMQHSMYSGGEDVHRPSVFGMNVVAHHDHDDGMGQAGDMGLGALSLSSLDGTLSMPTGGWDMREFVMGPSPDGRSVPLDSHQIPLDSSGVPLDGPVLPMEGLPLPPHADPGKAPNEMGAARTTESDEDLFAMYVFKVVHCSKQFVHDWKECPYAHEGETAR
jgi:hypothetical protein